jgi:sugar/nucleoside kinase (ribokinase family)
VDPQAAPGLTGQFREWVRGVDLLLPNADELTALGGPAALLEVVEAVAVTEGAAGARWMDRRGTWQVAVPNVDVVDATGAGDAFNAGLLVAWLRGATPAEALRAGCAAGATAVGALGARPSGTISRR